jgi:hypothetical protein
LKEQLRLLVELQSHDARIQEIEHSMRSLPAKLQPAKDDLARLEALLQGEKDALASTEAFRRDQERVLKQEDDAIKKAKSKLQSSSSTKEFAAANRELEAKRKSLSEREEEVLKIIDALESSRTTIADHEQDVVALREHILAEEQAIQGTIAKLAQEVEAQAAERESLVRAADGDLLKRYEHVRRRKGIALVPIEDGSCKGCHMRVPPQLANVLARQESVELCPHCQRLLFVPDMLAAPSSEE